MSAYKGRKKGVQQQTLSCYVKTKLPEETKVEELKVEESKDQPVKDDLKVEDEASAVKEEEQPLRSLRPREAKRNHVIDDEEDEEMAEKSDADELDEEMEIEQADDDEDENEDSYREGESLQNNSSNLGKRKRDDSAQPKCREMQVNRNKIFDMKVNQNIDKKRDYYANNEDINGREVMLDSLPTQEMQLKSLLKEVRGAIKSLEEKFFLEELSDKEDEEEIETSYMKQYWCIPISIDVNHLDFKRFIEEKKLITGQKFDVITMDPPWMLSSSNPTRGVAIAYDTLSDQKILDLPVDLLQDTGFIFIWVINAKYRFAIQMMEKWGYKMVDEITWVKQTVNGKIAKGHGYYLQHAKETCLVGFKGSSIDVKIQHKIKSDVIFSMRRGQSQKPEEIYEIAESLIPNGYYLEIFGRRNNLHNGWVTIGNEI